MVDDVPSVAPPEVPDPQGPAQEVPGWLNEILTGVLRDLQGPQPIEIHVGWTPGAAELEGTLWVQEAGDRSVTGVSVPRADTAFLTLHLADQLHEQFFLESSGAWGEARPVCPGHGHPADADLHDAAAWWVCPATREPLWRVGEAGS